jgi:hypothetical protein
MENNDKDRDKLVIPTVPESTIIYINKRLELLEAANTKLTELIEENTAMTLQVAANTKDIVILFAAAKPVVSFMMLTSKILRWGGNIAIAVASIWVLWYSIKNNTVPGSIFNGSKNP